MDLPIKRKYAKRIYYKEWINESKKILNSYDFRITLRQLFYVLISKGIIEKTENRYNSLSSKLVEGRKKGDIEWNALIDSTRTIVDKREDYLSIKKRVDSVIAYFNSPYTLPEDYGQKDLNIFYLEKESLKPFIEPHLYPNSILVIGKGFNSWSNAYELKKKLYGAKRNVHIYTLVDYDLSGVYIHNSFIDQVNHFDIKRLEIKDIAVTEEQIKGFNLPEHKGEVQLQALDPGILRDLITDTCINNWDSETYRKKDLLQEEMNQYYRKKLDKKNN